MAKSLVGKFEERVDLGDKPPTIEESLCLVLSELTVRGGLPSEMPRSVVEAAAWWVWMQEIPTQSDSPRRVSISGGSGQRWECPYHRRLEHTLRKFMGMRHEERHTILVAREEKIFWRGDEIHFFRRLIEETTRARKIGPSQYREEAISKMKKFHIGGSIDNDEEALAEREAIQQENHL